MSATQNKTKETNLLAHQKYSIVFSGDHIAAVGNTLLT